MDQQRWQGPRPRVSWRTGCAIIARSTAPATVSCERPSQPRDDARQTVREFLDRYPKPAYMSEVEHWRELSGGEIEFTMRRLRTAV